MFTLGQSSSLQVSEFFADWGITNMIKYEVARSFKQTYRRCIYVPIDSLLPCNSSTIDFEFSAYFQIQFKSLLLNKGINIATLLEANYFLA